MLTWPTTAVGADGERGLVERALRARTVSAHLDEALGTARAGGRRAPWTVVDAKYEPGRACTILYASGGLLAVARLAGPDGAASAPPGTLVSGLGLEVRLFPDDPALPGLARAFEPGAMAAALGQALPGGRWGAARVLRCRVSLLRYRPDRRATLGLDLRLRCGSGAVESRRLIGKMYHDPGKAVAVHRVMQMLWEAWPALPGGAVVARPAGHVPDLAMVLQEPVAGRPLDVAAHGHHVLGGAASALATLHGTRVTTGRRRPVSADVDRLVERAARSVLLAPELGRRARRLAAMLAAGAGRLAEWGAETALVHGDCKSSQFLVDGTRVALIDFDHAGMADPASDVGAFLAGLRKEAVGRRLDRRGPARRFRASDPEQDFLDAYTAAAAPGDGFALRARWYQAAALLRKALRSLSRSWRSPLVAALVDEAWLCLPPEGLPPEGLPPEGRA